MKLSAGLLLFRIADDRVEVLLVHMGGPFWARKDEHAWSVPKGEYEPGEDPADTAVREFTEELERPHPRVRTWTSALPARAARPSRCSPGRVISMRPRR